MGTDEGSGASAGGAGIGLEGLQFDKVDAPADAGRVCAGCAQPIAGEYFEIAGRIACRTCSAALTGRVAGTRRFLRASMFGAGAATVSMIIWYAIIKLANMELGLIAIGVGLFIGMAVRRGAAGLGGWKYQALAMVLTYGAVTVCKVPLVYQAVIQAHDNKKPDGAAAGDGDGDAAKDKAKADPANAENAKAPHEAPSLITLLLAVMVLVGLALASPFFSIGDNIMGIIIIGIALYEAWKLNKGVPIQGPFRLEPAVAPPFGAPPPTTTPPAGQ